MISPRPWRYMGQTSSSGTAQDNGSPSDPAPLLATLTGVISIAPPSPSSVCAVESRYT